MGRAKIDKLEEVTCDRGMSRQPKSVWCSLYCFQCFLVGAKHGLLRQIERNSVSMPVKCDADEECYLGHEGELKCPSGKQHTSLVRTAAANVTAPRPHYKNVCRQNG